MKKISACGIDSVQEGQRNEQTEILSLSLHGIMMDEGFDSVLKQMKMAVTL
jgi:hypothetical protein